MDSASRVFVAAADGEPEIGGAASAGCCLCPEDDAVACVLYWDGRVGETAACVPADAPRRLQKKVAAASVRLATQVAAIRLG
jgi:hypothetical protein